MIEYIKKSDVRHLLLHNTGDAALAKLDELESVDAVPVVRCGECKHFVENTWECSRLCDRFGDEYSDARVYPDWFCADGERKDGE